MRKPSLTVRPADRTGLTRFYGEPPRRTQKAIIGRYNGRPIAVGGVAFINGQVWAFCDLKPKAKQFPVTLFKACRTILNKAKADGARMIFARANPDEPTAPRFLTRLGFTPMQQDIWIWRA